MLWTTKKNRSEKIYITPGLHHVKGFRKAYQQQCTFNSRNSKFKIKAEIRSGFSIFGTIELNLLVKFTIFFTKATRKKM
jgi:hypothetical protein